MHPVAAVQSEYSLQTRLPELGVVQACEALGTALVAFSPVGRALLTDTPPTPERVAASEFMSGNPRFTGANFAANLAAHRRLPPARRRDGHERRGARDRLAAGAQPGGDPDPGHPLGRRT